MARRKHHKRRGSHVAGRSKRSMQHVMVLDGIGGGRRRRRGRRRSGALMGGLNMKELAPAGIDAGAAVAGAIGGLYLGGMIPASVPAQLKTAIPLLAGIALSMMARQRALKSVGLGLATIGGVALAQKFIPGMPGMSGAAATEQEIRALLQGGRAPLGIGAPMGAVSDMDGDQEFEGEDMDGAVSDMDGAEDFEGEDMEGAPMGYVTQANM